jgi:hypothetical protein
MPAVLEFDPAAAQATFDHGNHEDHGGGNHAEAFAGMT